MIITEYRIVLPLSLEEFRIGQLWSICKASKNETGGGEGVEVVVNEPFEDDVRGKGQYTHKVFHLASKVPSLIRKLAPKGSSEFHEKSWNSYPKFHTEYSTDYLKDYLVLTADTLHVTDFGDTENIRGLSADELKERRVIHIDIVNTPISEEDYKVEEDPALFTPHEKGRGPLTKDWLDQIKSEKSNMPYMCVYKLVKGNVQWFGLTQNIESRIERAFFRCFTNFFREVYCWMNHWQNLTIRDIREIEDQTKAELDQMRMSGNVSRLMIR